MYCTLLTLLLSICNAADSSSTTVVIYGFVAPIIQVTYLKNGKAHIRANTPVQLNSTMINCSGLTNTPVIDVVCDVKDNLSVTTGE